MKRSKVEINKNGTGTPKSPKVQKEKNNVEAKASKSDDKSAKTASKSSDDKPVKTASKSSDDKPAKTASKLSKAPKTPTVISDPEAIKRIGGNALCLGKIAFDDTLLLIDPIHIIPGERCRCGRPQTGLEKMGIYTYGDYLLKYGVSNLSSNPFSKTIKNDTGIVLRKMSSKECEVFKTSNNEIIIKSID